MFSLLLARTKCSTNNQVADYLTRQWRQCDVIVMALIVIWYSKDGWPYMCISMHIFGRTDVVITVPTDDLAPNSAKPPCKYSLHITVRHNSHNGVPNHQPHDCLLNRIFSRRSKKTSTLRVTDLCAGNSPGTGEFPAQRTSNVENVFIWWRLMIPRVENACASMGTSSHD